MKVSELARRAGIAPSAVRFYEGLGVLPAAARLPNGYREYADDDLSRLRIVVTLRRLGVSPLEAGRLAELCVARLPSELARDLTDRIDAQRTVIARQRAELDQLEAELVDLEATTRMTTTNGGATMADEPIRVLFVCTGNSARSQIAEALLRQFGGDDFVVFSAGTEPKGVNPLTVRALSEVGIDWSAARSKSVSEFLDQPFDYVITVCDRARQSCPVFPGEHNSLHWGLDDPAEVDGTDEEKLAAFRRTRTEVATRLRPFIELARRARRNTIAVA